MIKNNDIKMKIDGKKLINYESISNNRLENAIERLKVNEASSLIYRVEIVLTEKCNLECSYCKKRIGINDYEERVPKEVLMENLKEWANKGCVYVHFTGGEPTVVDYLEEIVQYTAELGMKPIITSNATADPSVYEALIRKGLSGIHISLDTNNSKEFDEIVAIKGSFVKVIDAIKTITSLRDNENFDVKLTINSTVIPETIANLENMLKYYLNLKPNDIKLMPISQLRKNWSDYSDMYYNELYPKLAKLVPKSDVDFTMLRNRVEYLVEDNIRGYHDYVPKHCYLMRDERLIGPDGKFYPCYINYRESGKCIGDINLNSIEEQKELLFEAAKDICGGDICKKYCADITARFNKAIDRVLTDNATVEEFTS